MSVPNYEFKSLMLETDFYYYAKEIDKAFYNAQSYYYKIPCELSFMLAIKLERYFLRNYKEEYEECRRVINAERQRKRRLNRYIEFMLTTGKCLFLTMTFSDEFLASTSSKTRRRYISWFLCQFKTYYIANIDYGEESNREHYHAIIQLEHLDMSLYNYGFIFVERINNIFTYKLTNYITKLTNHAVKISTKRNYLIFSSLFNPKTIKKVLAEPKIYPDWLEEVLKYEKYNGIDYVNEQLQLNI